MLQTGLLLLFLLPGLAAFCAFYGLFHNGKAIAPEPPAANSLQATAIIAGGSIIVHGLTALLFMLFAFACHHRCSVTPALLDPYHAAFGAISVADARSAGVFWAMSGLVAQAILVYSVASRWLVYRAMSDNLPPWIYGWAVDLANSLDNVDTVIVAYVLTVTNVGDQVVAYGGPLNDLALKPDGTIARITLVQCERYLVDLVADSAERSLSGAKSRFTFMVIDGAQIRNVSFEALLLPDQSTAPVDALAAALTKLYHIPALVLAR